jgi:xyloglucan-specific exo-beta-1,4-glucanase
MGDIGGFTHDNVAIAPKMLHTPLSGNINDVDFAGAKPLSVVRVSPDAKIFTSTDGGHAWTAYPGSAAGLSAGHVTYTANASSIVWTTDAGKTSFGLNGAAFVASTGIPTGAVVEADKANDTVVYASQAGGVYVSTDFGKSFTYVNQLGSAKESRAIATSTVAQAGEFWISTDRGVWHLYVHSGHIMITRLLMFPIIVPTTARPSLVSPVVLPKRGPSPSARPLREAPPLPCTPLPW